MKIIFKILLLTVIASLFIGGSAFAVVGGVFAIPQISEPALMFILGNSLIGIAGFGRQKLGLTS